MDNGDIRVHRSGGVSLEVCRQEEGCLDIFLECDTIVHHVDVTDHWNRHAQVLTCTPATHHNELYRAQLSPPHVQEWMAGA